MHIALWIIQGLCAGMFVMAGYMKAFKYDTFKTQAAWTADYSATFAKSLGILEIIGAIGLIAPSAMGILPILTPLAAAGLGIIMVGAVYTHIRINDPFAKNIPAIVLGVMCAIIAMGRW